MPRRSKPIPEILPEHTARFWARVQVGQPDQCWPWQGCTSAKGYGFFRISEKKNVLTHRIAYKLGHGVDPSPYFVCHRCDNPTCCNPGHLFLGTHGENVADCVRKGRQAIGDGHGKTRFSEDQVAEMRRLYASGMTTGQIGKKFGARYWNVWRIVTGRERKLALQQLAA